MAFSLFSCLHLKLSAHWLLNLTLSACSSFTILHFSWASRAKHFLSQYISSSIFFIRNSDPTFVIWLQVKILILIWELFIFYSRFDAKQIRFHPLSYIICTAIFHQSPSAPINQFLPPFIFQLEFFTTTISAIKFNF